MQKRFVFVKPFTCKYGTLKVGDQIDIVRGVIYFKGGLCEPWWADYLEDLVKSEMKEPNYLREVQIPYNKV